MLIGAGLMLVGFVLGRLHRPRRAPASPKEVCQCGHGVSTHDAAGCHKVNFITEKVIVGTEEYLGERRAITDKKIVDQHECFCVRYVGPHSSYVPELDS